MHISDDKNKVHTSDVSLELAMPNGSPSNKINM